MTKEFVQNEQNLSQCYIKWGIKKGVLIYRPKTHFKKCLITNNILLKLYLSINVLNTGKCTVLCSLCL